MGSFNPNIPLVTDPTLQSFRQLRANFQAINAAFGDNHVPFAADQLLAGKHNVLELQPQSVDPTTSATQVALYNKIVSSVPSLFYRPTSNGTPIQMTFRAIQTGIQSLDPTVYFPQQFSFVAGPFIIYAGFKSSVSNGDVVTLTPGTDLLFIDLIATNLQKSNLLQNAQVSPINISGTSFTIAFSQLIQNHTFDIFYLGIGQ